MKSNGAWGSAAEERQKKLLEYLAAKGKLKPPNPKPYLRDTTNRLQAARAQPNKVGAVVLQKENICSSQAKTKARPVVLPERPTEAPLRISNGAAPQRLRNVPQKAHSKLAPRLSRPSLGKVLYRGNPRIQARMEPSTSQRHPRDAVVSQAQVVRKSAELLKETVCIVSTMPEAWYLSQDEQQGLKDVQEQPPEGSTDPAISKCLPLEDQAKAKAVLTKMVTVSQNPNRRKNAINTHPPSKSLRNVTARTTTSKNGAGCAYMKSSDTEKTSKAAAPIRLCGKANVPTIPLSKKVLQNALSRTLLPGKGEPESKSAIVKSILGVKKAGISMSGKRASMVKLQEKPTAVPCVVKNSTSGAQKSKSRTVSCTLTKSKDTVPLRHTEDNSATVNDRRPNRRPLFYTPAPVPPPAFPRNAVTEVKAGQDDRRAVSAEKSRRLRLEDWMNSKGKAYKRPPMMMPAKKPAKKKARLSFWAGIEEEDDLNSLAEKITKALSECLRLVEEGFPSETVQTTLSKIPQCEKFAKYWVCKAKLLEQGGTFDVIGLYEQAVRAGATPIEELRETIFNIMKNINKTPKAVTFGPLPDEDASVPAETVCNIEQSSKESDILSYHDVTNDGQNSPNILTRHWTDEQGSALKFQIVQLPRVKESTVVPDWKILTPVRRSLRIERAVSYYPDTLREHDTVVSSLNDLLDTEENCFVYRENEALPKEVDSKIRAL